VNVLLRHTVYPHLRYERFLGEPVNDLGRPTLNGPLLRASYACSYLLVSTTGLLLFQNSAPSVEEVSHPPVNSELGKLDTVFMMSYG